MNEPRGLKRAGLSLSGILGLAQDGSQAPDHRHRG